MPDRSNALTRLLWRARRRYLAHAVLSQAALACSCAVAGFVLLLLLGTQVLDWYWIALLAGGVIH